MGLVSVLLFKHNKRGTEMINTNAQLSKSQVKAICAKAKKQLSPNTAETRMFFAIFELAMLDNYCTRVRSYKNGNLSSCDIGPEDALSAAKYLHAAEEHLPAIGLDPAWISRMINETSEKRPTICQSTPVGPHLR